MNTLTIQETNFEKEVLQAQKPVVVDFWAPWCGYCRRLSPVVDRLAEQYGEQVQIAKLNTDENPALTEQYDVDTIPTLILFQNGKASEPLVNPESQASIQAWLKEHGAL